jgi:quercetin dioxygenase-like cupin family protein
MKWILYGIVMMKIEQSKILEGKGWQFQRDNELPLELKIGDSIFIPRHQVHRVIKGETDLKIKING